MKLRIIDRKLVEYAKRHGIEEGKDGFEFFKLLFRDPKDNRLETPLENPHGTRTMYLDRWFSISPHDRIEEGTIVFALGRILELQDAYRPDAAVMKCLVPFTARAQADKEQGGLAVSAVRLTGTVALEQLQEAALKSPAAAVLFARHVEGADIERLRQAVVNDLKAAAEFAEEFPRK
jgi:hypothetical protein